VSALRYRVEIRVPGEPVEVVAKVREIAVAAVVQAGYFANVAGHLAANRQKAALNGDADPFPDGVKVAIVDRETGLDL
jgi:hypothetical protein